MWKIEKSSTKTPKFKIRFGYYSWCFSLSWMFQFFEFIKIFDYGHFFGLFQPFFWGPLKILICHGRNVLTGILTLRSIWDATPEKPTKLFWNSLGLIYSLSKTHTFKDYSVIYYSLTWLRSLAKFPSVTFLPWQKFKKIFNFCHEIISNCFSAFQNL